MTPLPVATLNTLVADLEYNFPIAVHEGELAVVLDNQPYSSEFEMSSLSDGWHHLAAVGCSGEPSTTTFYVDFK